jgi:class 3 adenylate cyclase
LAALLGLLFAVPGTLDQLGFFHRLGIDFLLPLRHAAFGSLYPSGESDVVVVVIDEETYGTAPFNGTPEVAWTPYLARVIDAVGGAGPRVMGLDLVYPTSLDRPDLLQGYDKPLLKSLFRFGRKGTLVFGQVRLSTQKIGPYPSQVIAGGGGGNLRTLNLMIDRDDVVRRYPAGYLSDSGQLTPSFGVELAMRAGAAKPEGDFLINFSTGADDIPTFGLADLHRCVLQENHAFFERFRDKIVLFGSVLDVEDRRLSAKRFTAGRLDRTAHPRCSGAFDAARFGELIDRHSIAGVYIHAAAINTLTKELPLDLMAPLLRFVTVFLATSGLAVAFFSLAPVPGLAVGIAVYLAETAGSVLAIEAGTVAPLLFLGAGGAATFATVYAYRFAVEDKEKRWIQHAFRHFLAPSLVDRLSNDPSVLELGGVQRHVTVFFSDLAGFTDLSESMKEDPAKLLDILNRYLSIVTEVIERHGGYVDKFIGDAVMAMWGAPLNDSQAERHAVDAAIACQAALAKFNLELTEEDRKAPQLHTRIGINSGIAVVGNMGSRTRLNYTVAGDTVNLASRLEGANKLYGTRIMIGETTAAGLQEDYLIRRLDTVAVKGRRGAVRVYEVLGPAGEVPAELVRRAAAFEDALQLYQARRFEEARAIFMRYAEEDAASALYVARCSAFMEEPPGADWDGSFTLTSK